MTSEEEWTPEQALRAIARRVGVAEDSPPKTIAAEVDLMLGVYESATDDPEPELPRERCALHRPHPPHDYPRTGPEWTGGPAWRCPGVAS